MKIFYCIYILCHLEFHFLPIRYLCLRNDVQYSMSREKNPFGIIINDIKETARRLLKTLGASCFRSIIDFIF